LVRLAGGPRRGRVLLSAGDTEVGARLDLQLASGRLEVVVDKKSGQDT
jgi:hypothetical protein